MIKKLSLLFALMLSTLMASAHDIEVKNADGVTIYYNYINNGTELAVSFRGSSHASYSNEYQGNVVIPEEVTYMNRTRKVTSIGGSAFYNCYKLTSVTIPNSVKSIGGSAFYACSGLTSITIPNSVTNIGISAFSGCSGLTSVTIPNSVKSIGGSAFYACSGLTSVTIPNSVTSIGERAFYNCSGLTSVTIPNSVTSIEYGVFYNCSGLTSITIPNSVTSIGSSAFDGVNIPTVVSLIENPFQITGKTSDSRTFSKNTFNNATLYVPKGTIEKYKATFGWTDFLFIEEGEGPGGDTPETQKCSTPTISYENGKLTFDCETEGVEYVSSITPPSAFNSGSKTVSMPTTYKVTVYAKKDGYENSDVATKEIDLGTSGIRGDLNGDGIVNMPDAMFIVNRILNGKFPDEEDNGSKPGVRFGFYETIPGYSVKIDKVNMDGVSPYVMGSNAVGTILSRTSSQPTWDNANGSYSFVDIANSNDMFVRIDYTLTADDGSGEKIVVKDAIAAIPSQYIQWKPNYKYSYIIKVYYNSYEFYEEGTPLFNIYPASFDAIVIEDDNGQSTITNITTR